MAMEDEGVAVAGGPAATEPGAGNADFGVGVVGGVPSAPPQPRRLPASGRANHAPPPKRVERPLAEDRSMETRVR